MSDSRGDSTPTKASDVNTSMGGFTSYSIGAFLYQQHKSIDKGQCILSQIESNEGLNDRKGSLTNISELDSTIQNEEIGHVFDAR